jgi:hypothetical protein
VWLLAVVLPPTLFLSAFLAVRMPPGRILLGTAAMVIAGYGLVRWTRCAIAGRRDLLAAMLIGTGATLTFTLLWNEAYLNFVKLVVEQKEVFREAMHKYFAPFYGRWRVASVLASLPAVALLVGLCVGAWKWRISRPMRWWGLPLIMLLQLAMIAAMGVTDVGIQGGVDRIRGTSRGLVLFRQDARIFRSVGELYAAYVPSMPRLNYFSQHYPPGPQTIFVLERVMGEKLHLAKDSPLRAIGGWATPVCVCLATAFIYLAARAISPRPLVHNTAAVAFAAAPGMLLYPLLSVTPIVVLPGAIALWALLRGMRGWVTAVLLGAVLGAAMTLFAVLSFSAIFFAAVLALLWLACVQWKVAKLSNLAVVAAVAILTAGVLLFALRVYAQFDMRTCTLIAVHLQGLQAKTNGFDTPGQWFMRSTGNALAFALANLPLVGIAVASLLAWQRDDSRRIDRLILPVTVLAMALSAASGKFYLETERVWTLFLPFLAVGAAVELAREDREADVRAAVMAMLLFVVVQEIIFTHGAL